MNMRATIGDVVDWRALARAHDIPRRPSLGQPDRGYVDQSPAETPKRAPTVIPLARLEEAIAESEREREETRDALADKLEEARERAMAQTERPPAAPEPVPVPPSAGPSTLGQATLVRFERTAVYGGPPPPPPREPETLEPREGKDYVTGPNGKRAYTDEYKRLVMAAYVKAREADATVSQQRFAARNGLNQSLMSKWTRELGVELPVADKISADERARRLDYAQRALAQCAPGSRGGLAAFARREGLRVRDLWIWVREYRAQTQPNTPRQEPTLMSRPTPPDELDIPPSVKGKRRSFTNDQRRAILAKGPELTHAKLASKCGVSPSLVARWREDFGRDGQKGKRKPKGETGVVVRQIHTNIGGKQSNGARTIELVSRELSAAKAEQSALAERITALKQELVELL